MYNSFLELFDEKLAEFGDPQAALAAANSAAGTNYTMQALKTMQNPVKTNTSTGLFAGLSGLGSRFGAGKSLLGNNWNLPNLKGAAKKFQETTLFGEPGKGPTVAQTANTLSGIYQGLKAGKGLMENYNSERDLDSLKDDISTQIAANPMYNMYLDPSDEKLIRQMNNKSMTNNWGSALEGGVKGLPKALISALIGGATGGIGGAAIGGIGSLINSGIEGYGRGTEQMSSQLQGLYGRLKQANEEYQTMRRPSGLRSAGLQTRYFNQLY